MSPEAPLTPEAQFPLKNWYGKMHADDRAYLEAEFFNDNVIPPLDTVFQIRDAENARSIKHILRLYLEARYDNSTFSQLRKIREEMGPQIGRILDKEREAA